MKKYRLKQYGKIVAAAVFLTVAGLSYTLSAKMSDAVPLKENGQAVLAETSETDLDMNIEESSEERELIYVHICGEIKYPGVYGLSEESRIFEAVEAAGGFTEQAAESSWNLAQKVTDGMQIVILSLDQAEEQERLKKEMASGIVNINTATKDQLMTLTGIGEARAEDILRYREESGGFQTKEDIMKVPGIKESAYLKIKDSITV